MENLVWAPHETNVFEMVRVLEEDIDLNNVIVEYADSSVKKLNRSVVHDVHPSHLLNLDDLCNMNNLHEAPLLDIIKRRLASDLIYTFTADFLVSLNPYKLIPGVYDNPMSFLSSQPTPPVTSMPVIPKAAVQKIPHIFTIADAALKDATAGGKSGGGSGAEVCRDQSIIITGESGAGKTEASKYVITFLTLANSLQDQREGGGRGELIKNLIVESSVIFESFGNSKTVRNDNSSRFGKYIKLQYSVEDILLSATTETFLLEKSRLVAVGKGERNYHIFYQLIRGLEAIRSPLVTTLHLTSVDDFSMLTEGQCTVITSEESDVHEFRLLTSALSLLGCSEAELDGLWGLLAVILHMGNVQFVAIGDDNTACEVKSRTMSLDNLAELLGVTSAGLCTAFTTQKMQAARRGSVHVKILSSSDCKNNLMALMKWLYKTIFSWLVRKVNCAHHSFGLEQAVKFIGILDIFGFEILGTNSFEQLCINYTNERLQQQFNEHVFVLEQEEYAREGLDWKAITFRDNQHVIDLISKKPLGLLITLEEHGMMNRKPDDVALLNAFNQANDKVQPAYAKSRFGNDRFVVKHFAGDVTYVIEGFLVKNNDSLQDDLLELLASTTNPFIANIICSDVSTGSTIIPTPVVDGPGYIPLMASLAPPAPPAEADVTSKRMSTSKKMASSVTVSFQFRNQLDLLMSTLRSTHPHYVKCIKPNALKQAGTFTAPLVMEQLRYSGILEVVRIRREGYPSRMTFFEFYQRYEILGHGKGWKKSTSGDCTDVMLREYSDHIAATYLPHGTYQIGTSFVFLGHDSPDRLQDAINNFYKIKATKLQAKYKCYSCRVRYLAALKKVVAMQTQWRTHFAARVYKRTLRQIKGIQKCYRLLKFRQLLADKTKLRIAKLRNAKSIHIQRIFRGHQSRLKSLAWRRLLTQLQIKLSSSYRGLCNRRAFLTTKSRAIQIQSLIRKRIGQVNYAKTRRTVIRLQAFVRKLLKSWWFGKQKSKAITLQSWIRSTKLVRWYKFVIKSCVKIQSLRRQLWCKREFVRQKSSAIRLQTVHRRFSCRKHFRASKQSAVMIQSIVRGRKVRLIYEQKLRSAIRIQSLIRRFLQRCRYLALLSYLEKVDKCIQIQSVIRRFNQRCRYLALCEEIARNAASVQIQSAIRRFNQRCRYLALCEEIARNAASVQIQSAIRRFNQRCRYLALCEEISRRDAATQIQTSVRRYLKRKQYLEILLEILRQKSATRLQTMYRSVKQRSQFCLTKSLVVRLQSFGRMIICRRSFEESVLSALFIQSAVRRYLCEMSYRNKLFRIIVIQSKARAWLQRLRYLQAYDAVVRIQSLGRMICARNQYESVIFSAILIQTATRRYLELCHYQKARGDIIGLQALWRRSLARIQYHRKLGAVVTLQSFSRMLAAQNLLETAIFSALLLQNAFRCHLCYRNYQKTRVAVVHIQRSIRGFMERQRHATRLFSVVLLQSFGRMIISRTRYENCLYSAVLIQTAVRRSIAEKHYAAARAACIAMQSVLRMYVRKLQYKRSVSSAVHIQARWRAFFCQRYYWYLHHCAVNIHRIVRGFVAWRKFQRALYFTIRLQSFVRSWSASRQYQSVRSKVVLAQSLVRRFLSILERLRRRASCLRLNACARRFLLNKSLRIRLNRLLDCCRMGQVSVFRSHLSKYPGDLFIRHRQHEFATLYQMAAGSNQIELIRLLQCTHLHILDKDKSGNRLLHYLARNPNLELALVLSFIMNQIKTSVEYEVKDEDDDADDDESHHGPGAAGAAGGGGVPSSLSTVEGHAIDAVSGLPILRSGWMKKKRNTAIMGFKKWDRRWCVLTEETISYYKSDARNAKPCGFLPLEGCVVERSPGKECIVTVISPQVVFKKGMFGDTKIGPLVLQVESERDIQEWLNPLKSSAGVLPFRTTTIHYVNTDLRAMWLRMKNKFGENALHVLASRCEVDVELSAVGRRSSGSDPTVNGLQLASWLIASGCPIRDLDVNYNLPLSYAVQRRNAPLAKLFSDRLVESGALNALEADLVQQTKAMISSQSTLPSTRPLPLLSPVKGKGYSYLQIHFMEHVNDGRFDSVDVPSLMVNVLNSKQELLEQTQEFFSPVVVKSHSYWWGCTWYMQTPIENVDDDCRIQITLNQNSATKKVELATSTYLINKSTIDTGNQIFSFASCSDSSGGAGASGGLVVGGMQLNVDLILTKKFRYYDLENIK